MSVNRTPLNLHILSAPFTLKMVQMLNLAQTHTKRITVRAKAKKFNHSTHGSWVMAYQGKQRFPLSVLLLIGWRPGLGNHRSKCPFAWDPLSQQVGRAWHPCSSLNWCCCLEDLFVHDPLTHCPRQFCRRNDPHIFHNFQADIMHCSLS